VIGPGRLGAALLAGLRRAGLAVVAVGVHAPTSVDRGAVPPRLPVSEAVALTLKRASSAAFAPDRSAVADAGSDATGPAEFHPAETGPANSSSDDTTPADVVWLTVPDDALESVVATVTRAVRARASVPAGGGRAAKPGTAAARRAERFVVHSSGAASVTVLEPLAELGFHTLSLHPLQSFAAGEGQADVLQDVPFAVTASDAVAEAFGNTLVRRLGGRPFLLSDAQKGRYHLAATVASNLLVALESQATELMNEAVGASTAAAGTQAAVAPPALDILGPLVRTTLANVLRLGPERALTGPVARGDVTTVRTHLALLADYPERFATAYRALSLQALALAAPRLDDEAVRVLRHLLAPDRSGQTSSSPGKASHPAFGSPTAADAHPQSEDR
jgi:predicted short-subunit dehydrogenase-like oxidoreductase (DUF2520 family)